MTQLKTQNLTIFLMKEDKTKAQDCLRSPDTLDEIKLVKGLPFTGILFVKKPFGKPPKWLSFLQEGTGQTLDLTNKSNSAVLFLKQNERLFAITYGYGRNLLHTNCWEENFGLKVVLNTVDPDKLRCMDLERFENLKVSTKTQTSRESDLGAFGIDPTQDFLRAATGTPKNANFAKKVTGGADALVLSAKLAFSDLGAKCAEVLEAYDKDDYKEYFGWIDNLTVVKDPKRIESLDKKLVELLQKKSLPNGLYLSPPEIVDWAHTEGFKYGIQNDDEQVYEDLDIDTYLSFIDNRSEITLEKLKRDRIEPISTGSSTGYTHWSVYQAIVFEIKSSKSHSLYILSSGRWFKAEQNYADVVTEAVKKIKVLENFSLPDAIKKEREDRYNQRAVESDSGKLCLMDKKLFRPSGASSSVEFCDILTLDRDIIHVKKYNGSSVMSHLFSQGMVSAETFLMDADFRRKVQERLKSDSPNFSGLITPQSPDARHYRVVFAVIGESDKNLPDKLPFFSQLNLMQVTQRLENLLSFNVGYVPVNIQKNGKRG